MEINSKLSFLYFPHARAHAGIYYENVVVNKSVCVLVHSSISNQISAEIDRYVADIAAEGLDAHVVVWDGGDDCLAVKTLPQDEYSQGMIGAFLVGDIPVAWYEYDYEVWNPNNGRIPRHD